MALSQGVERLSQLVVGSGPGFQINLYGLPPATLSEVLLDTYFQPGKLPDSLAD